eukprot:COSAG06_NODE_1933_length_8038_cov_156.326779_4_plen_69_part_00
MAAADADLTASDDDARMTEDERALDPTGIFGEGGRAGRPFFTQEQDQEEQEEEDETNADRIRKRRRRT